MKKMKKLIKNGRRIYDEDRTVGYEINNAGPGFYSIVKFTGHQATSFDSGKYIEGPESGLCWKGMEASIAACEADCGGKIGAKVKQQRRTSAQKRRDNFVLYD